MPVAFTRFPYWIKEEILDLMECYDLFNFSETSKRSRSLARRPAKQHEGNMKMEFPKRRRKSDSYKLKLIYSSTSHHVPETPISLEYKDSEFEHLEKYLSVRHSSLFSNITISMDFFCAAPFETAFLTLEHFAELGYPIEECDIHCDRDNEAIIRALCREITLYDSYFEESEVIEFLKSWKSGSSIRYLSLTYIRAGSNEDFGTKMLEINAEPVPRAGNEDANIANPSLVLSWSLHQDNSDLEVWITIASYPQSQQVFFELIFKL
ncbi:unnamed protein product [Caenorhabditis nigoni]